MKSSIAVYDSHDEAIHALNLLKDRKFSLDKVSIIGKAEIVDDNIHLRSNTPIIASPLIAGSTIGATLGLLTGIGIIAVPGLGFLYGAGAIVGALGGLDLGVIAGGIGSILLGLGFKDDYSIKFEEHIKSGKYLLFINGTENDINKAKKIIEREFNMYSSN